jgi:1-acyl-sn-glycerol-3-phosphate acyltransferase
MHYVMAANHQTYLDPWVVPGSIPFGYWIKMGLPRAFVANRFFGYFFVGNLLRSVGSFPAKEHPTDPYGLDYAFTVMERGQSIMIFPEGGLSKKREKPARRGVMVLAQQPNVRIIPVHIEWRHMDRLSTFDIGIGKPFDGSKMSAQEIMDRIYDQPTS